MSKVLGVNVSYYVTKKSIKDHPCKKEEEDMVGGTITSDPSVFQKSDLVLAIGQHISSSVKQLLKGLNVPMIIIRLGNDFCYDINRFLNDNPIQGPYEKKKGVIASVLQGQGYTETWISPHFAYARAYYDFISKKPLGSTPVVPYFWSPMFFQRLLEKTGPLLPCTKGDVRVAVFESNQTLQKSVFYPMIICHYANPYIRRALFMCCARLKNKNSRHFPSFYRFCTLADGQKKGKYSFEGRIPTLKVMQSHANVILSWHRDWGLNFLPLEALFANIPIIHNSEEMKEFGFYYHENDVASAVKHLKHLHEHGFDAVAYKKRNAAALVKFGIQQPKLRTFVIHRIRQLIQDKLIVKTGGDLQTEIRVCSRLQKSQTPPLNGNTLEDNSSMFM